MMNFEQALDYIESTGAAVHAWLPWVHQDRWIGLQYVAFWENGETDETTFTLHLERLPFADDAPPGDPLHQRIVVSSLLAAEVARTLGTDPRGLRYAGCDAPVPAHAAEQQFLQHQPVKAGTLPAGPLRLTRQQAGRLCQGHTPVTGWPCRATAAAALPAAA